MKICYWLYQLKSLRGGFDLKLQPSFIWRPFLKGCCAAFYYWNTFFEHLCITTSLESGSVLLKWLDTDTWIQWICCRSFDPVSEVTVRRKVNHIFSYTFSWQPEIYHQNICSCFWLNLNVFIWIFVLLPTLIPMYNFCKKIVNNMRNVNVVFYYLPLLWSVSNHRFCAWDFISLMKYFSLVTMFRIFQAYI